MQLNMQMKHAKYLQRNNPFSITRGSTVIVKRAVLLTQLHRYPTFPKNSSVAKSGIAQHYSGGTVADFHCFLY
jgi:hypothetical protein